MIEIHIPRFGACQVLRIDVAIQKQVHVLDDDLGHDQPSVGHQFKAKFQQVRIADLHFMRIPVYRFLKLNQRETFVVNFLHDHECLFNSQTAIFDQGVKDVQDLKKHGIVHPQPTL